MEPWQFYEWLVRGTVLLFVFAFGACVGSLTNVLVYRLPRGLDVITPTSRCPKCNTKLTFKENIPILGWLILRGKCRFCLSKISPEYPIVETIVAILFAALYTLFYLVPQDASWLGVPWGNIAPEWARSDRNGWAATTWPIFTVVALLAGGLVAMTIIDLRTYTVPLQIPWFLTAAAVLLHTGYALFVETLGRGQLRLTAPNTQWSIPTPNNWTTIAAVLAATAGLAVSMLLLKAKLITQSFADYDDWARAQGLLPPLPSNETTSQGGHQNSTTENTDHPDRPTSAGVDDHEDQPEPLLTPDALITAGTGYEPPKDPSQGGPIRGVVIHLAAILIAAGLGAAASAATGLPDWTWLASALTLGPLLAAATLNAIQQRNTKSKNTTPPQESPTQGGQKSEDRTPIQKNTTTSEGDSVRGVAGDTEVTGVGAGTGGVGGVGGVGGGGGGGGPHEWIMYPHARREMVRELAFLAAPVLLAILGAWVAPRLLEAGILTADQPPLWIAVLAGVLLGYLVGGAVVWAVRIVGTLAFGKEALGLGDVHMMAAVGACLGWIDATLAFFAGAFVGIYLTIQGLLRSGQAARALPFVPALATGTLLVILLKPLLETLLNNIIPIAQGQPPINIP